MATELRPLIVAYSSSGLLTEPLLFKAELPPSARAATAHNFGARRHAQREALEALSGRLETLPFAFLEFGEHRSEGFPFLALSPRLADPRDPAERAAAAAQILGALICPQERANGFALAHWVVREHLGARFVPQEFWSVWDLTHRADLRATMASVRLGLAPWLAGGAPVSDLDLFTQFHTGLSDEARVLCLIACRRDNLRRDNLTTAGAAVAPLVALLPALAAQGWLTDRDGNGRVYRMGRKLRALARYEVLLY